MCIAQSDLLSYREDSFSKGWSNRRFQPMTEYFGLCGIMAIQEENAGLKFLKCYNGNVLIEGMNTFGPREHIGIYPAGLLSQFGNYVGVE